MKKIPLDSQSNITKYSCKKKIIIILKNATHHRNSHQQLPFSSLEKAILPDYQVRFKDPFGEYIDFSTLNFAIKTLKIEDRPSFNSPVFLKINK